MERVLQEAVSFDDVILLPGRSRVEPRQVDIRARFSRNTVLNIPLASAPMDTVSGWRLAATLALYGGIGVIHRNMSIEEQVRHVENVKRHPLINVQPVALHPAMDCCAAREALLSLELRDAPVVDSNGRLLGLARLSRLRSCRCGTPLQVLLEPHSGASSPAEALALLLDKGLDTVALVQDDGRFVGTVTREAVFRDYNPALDEEGRLLAAAAVSPFDEKRFRALDGVADVLVFDVAHFHNDNVMRAAARLASTASSDIVVGNIGTADAVVDAVTLIDKVDGLRVGIAGGNICTTSGVAGVAAPTLYAVMQAVEGLRQLGLTPHKLPIIADGGVRGSGDAVKALAAGAYTVMAGYLLAGTEEAEAPVIRIGGEAFKPYRGMASRGAMEKRFAVDRYSRVAKKVEEGIEGLVPYKGPLYRVVVEFAEGVRAGLGYAGASSIPELWEKARFARITSRIGAFTGTVKTKL